MADLFYGAIAPPPTEDEVNGGQHIPLLQLGQHKGQADASRRPVAPTVAGARCFLTGDASPFLAHRAAAPAPAPCHAVVKLQRHRAKIGINQLGRAVDLLQPVRQLIAVFHRGRQGQQLNLWRAVDDRLFPHGAPLAIVHVVTLIQHHGLYLLQSRCPFRQCECRRACCERFRWSSPPPGHRG
jgi:hypothetical protein